MTNRRSIAVLLAMALTVSACSVHRLSDDAAVAADADRSAAGSPRDPGTNSSAGGSDGGPGTTGAGDGSGTGSAAPAPGSVTETGDQAPARQPTASEETRSSKGRVASDQGVTPDEIELGILHTSDAFYTALGGSTKSVEEVIAPFIAEINEQGGINGRTVVPRISAYDPLSVESMQAACVEQAEDHKVFASIAQIGFYGDAEVCMANKEIPLLTFNNSSEKTNVERERGFVRQTNQNKDRNLKNWIDWMTQSGLLDRTVKTGLIYVDVPEDRDLVHEVVLPYLEAKGLPRPEIATLSPSIAQTPAEAQAAVLRFSSRNVEMVLPLVSFLRILIFAEQAEAFNYRPEYSVSDFGLLSTDAMAGMPPAQWEGVRGITNLRTGMDPPGELPSSAAFVECNGVYERFGEQLAPHPDDPERREGVEVANMLHYCEHLALWADAARRAGANPTRRSLLRAYDDTGTWSHRVGLTERLTFRPGKFDGADLYAVVQWKSNCTSDGGCYRQVEGFRAGAW